MTRFVSPESLSCIVPTGTLCSTSPSLPWVAWVSLPHVPWYYTTLRLPPGPLGVLRLSLVPRYLACFPRSWCPCRARGQAEAPGHARAFGHPVPQSGSCARRQVVLPSSRATPVKTCPALRPRWCPVHSPCRTQDCCLPAHANRRLLPPYCCGYPVDHDSTYFGAQ